VRPLIDGHNTKENSLNRLLKNCLCLCERPGERK
jgi:hypothetical protein